MQRRPIRAWMKKKKRNHYAIHESCRAFNSTPRHVRRYIGGIENLWVARCGKKRRDWRRKRATLARFVRTSSYIWLMGLANSALTDNFVRNAAIYGATAEQYGQSVAVSSHTLEFPIALINLYMRMWTISSVFNTIWMLIWIKINIFAKIFHLKHSASVKQETAAIRNEMLFYKILYFF